MDFYYLNLVFLHLFYSEICYDAFHNNGIFSDIDLIFKAAALNIFMWTMDWITMFNEKAVTHIDKMLKIANSFIELSASLSSLFCFTLTALIIIISWCSWQQFLAKKLW